MPRALLFVAPTVLAVGCFGSHDPSMDDEVIVDPPACVASAPVIAVPEGPGCASIDRLVVQDLPAAPLERCALGVAREVRPVQPVYVANLGDGPVVVEVEHLSTDCLSGAFERCGGASASSADGCACAGESYGLGELLDRSTIWLFDVGSPGGTIFVGGDRVSYRITACRLPTSSDPFPIGCSPSGEGDVSRADCDGVLGSRAEGVDASGATRPICYCAPECATDADCPRTSAGEVAPFCDHNGVCRLPCDEGGSCPPGTECVRVPRLEHRFDRPVCATVAP